MGFTRLEFPIFLLLVSMVAWATRRVALRNAALLCASYYFYAYWDVRFCGLLFLSTVTDFVVAKQIARSKQTSVRRRWLLISLIVNLGALGFFKYANFFLDSAHAILSPLGLSTSTLNIILPVGISFYTFQTLSYTLDVYRGKMRPTDRFVDFALYVAFFPQLVAGPIVRARELLPQLTVCPSFSKRRLYGGVQQMLRGAVKKVLIADRLGEAVDVVFAGPDLYGGVTIWIAVIAYTGQIYYDFSGYSDLAIGAAKVLGYRFPANFRHPYLATSIVDFWHRWHMTLSRWLRDYLYIPLGGSRGTSIGTYRNLILTMTLGGLWHGAAWTFVLWGMLHGLALCIQRLVQSRWRIPPFISVILLWVVVLHGWILFRSSDLVSAIDMAAGMWSFREGILWLPPLALLAIALMLLEHVLWRTRFRRAMRLPHDAWYSPVATAVLLWCLVLYAPQGFRPFVYFQF